MLYLYRILFCLLFLFPISCCHTNIIKIHGDDANLFPLMTPVVPDHPILHCYNASLSLTSRLMFEEAQIRFKTPVVIDMHGGYYGKTWIAMWDIDKFGERKTVAQFAETYLKKYRDCDIVFMACNERGVDLNLNVPPTEAHRVWYFKSIVWIVPDSQVPYFDGFSIGAPWLVWHETDRGYSGAGSIWEAEQAKGIGEFGKQNSTTQPTTQEAVED